MYFFAGSRFCSVVHWFCVWGGPVKQEGMLDHYQETYRVTHRFEYERNRLFVLFILVLIVAIYLALAGFTALFLWRGIGGFKRRVLS